MDKRRKTYRVARLLAASSPSRMSFATLAPVGTQVTALIVFTDIRNFTGWSDQNEVASSLDAFVEGFESLLHRHFDGFTVKSTGDGAMLVKVIEPLLHGDALDALLVDALGRIQAFEGAFEAHCTSFAECIGQPAALRLGWGITRGQVKHVRDDFFGSNANKAARLCDVARPAGIAISKPDFPRLPHLPDLVFEAQERVLRGLEPEPVWITTVAAREHLPREKVRETPEVHVAGVCVDFTESAPRILMARRVASRKLYPGRWEGCGGQLRYNETFLEGVRRHFLAEMRLDVDVLAEPHCLYVINEANTPVIPGLRFLCTPRGERVPRLIGDRHSEARWVTEDELRGLAERELIPGWRDEVLALLAAYRTRG